MTGSVDSSQTRGALSCPSTCFTLFIVISLLTHIAELFLNAVYTWFIQADLGNPVWTATILGFLLLPLVVTQLFSAILFLWRRDSADRKKSVFVVALIHVLQVGFIWRHLNILNEGNVVERKKLLVDLLLLRLIFAFTSGLPLLSLQTYYIVTSNLYHGIQLAAMIMCLLSTSWALASFRRQNEACNIEKVVLTWPGISFRLLWRIGEITTRVLSLAVFASSYKYWTLLVLALHWLTMLICIWATILGTVNRKEFGRGSHAMICVAIGYVYTFTHLNFSQTRSKCRYISYYLIIFLETCVLVVTWLLHNPTWHDNIKSVSIFATIVSAFILCLVSMVIYYTCIHVELSEIPQGNNEICMKDECINCKLSLCAKHSQVLQRPFNTGWTSQYQNAVNTGHYYRNVLQDSLLDSASELEERCHGNSSFNDREVELIMETGVSVHSEPVHNTQASAEVEEQQPESSSHGLGATVSATSTVKSALDLYNNLDNVQSDKSFISSSVLKDKSFRDTATLSSSPLQIDSEFWNRDGLSDGGLGGYNLPVSYIGHDSSSQKLNPSHKQNRKATLSEPMEMAVLYVNVCQSSADVSVEDNRYSSSRSPREAAVVGTSRLSRTSDVSETFVQNHPKNHTRPEKQLDRITFRTSCLKDGDRTKGNIVKGKGSKRERSQLVTPWCPDDDSATETGVKSTAPSHSPTGVKRNSPGRINDLPVPVKESFVPVNDSAVTEPPPINDALLSGNCSPVPISDSLIPLGDSPVSISGSPVPTSNSPVPVNDSHVPISYSPVLISDSHVPINDSRVPISYSPVLISDSHVPISESPTPINDSFYFNDSDSDDYPEMII